MSTSEPTSSNIHDTISFESCQNKRRKQKESLINRSNQKEFIEEKRPKKVDHNHIFCCAIVLLLSSLISLLFVMNIIFFDTLCFLFCELLDEI
jgi:hypothetical protein